MPDGNCWCDLTNKPDDCHGINYTPGSGRLYSPEKHAEKMTTPVSNKPKPAKTPSVVSTHRPVVKAPKPQSKLF